jgi:hypothetical protein
MIWKGILMTMHNPSAQGNYCDEHGRAQVLSIAEEIWHMGYMERNRMIRTYSVGQ